MALDNKGMKQLHQSSDQKEKIYERWCDEVRKLARHGKDDWLQKRNSSTLSLLQSTVTYTDSSILLEVASKTQKNALAKKM